MNFDSLPEGRPLAATAQHIELLTNKRASLLEKQRAAERQFLTAVDREWTSGRLSSQRLYDMYVYYREQSGIGHSSRWNQIVSIKSGVVTSPSWREKQEWVERAAASSSSTDVSGVYPLATWSPTPPKGVAVVYVLFDSEGQACYVGSTDQLRVRLRAHAKDGKAFVSWQAHICTDRDDAYRTERRWLAAYLPYLNKRRA